MKRFSVLLLLLFSAISYGQEIDTLTFFSHAFNEERSVFIHKPKLYKHKSDSLRLPVIYLLDGQHEWFVNPTISDIQYLRFTKEIPSAIIVVVPLKNRIKECAIAGLKTELPLDKFLTKELDKALIKYNPSNLKIIIGHSYSASFSLYTFYKHPNYYSAVIANSPYDKMEMLLEGIGESELIDKTKISISIGSVKKDVVHRKKYNELKEQYPSFFKEINIFEADYSAHNSLPIVAIPTLLTKIFEEYRARYFEIAKVDMEYKLINKPGTITEELDKIKAASKIGIYDYPPEISDINGMASRYWNNGFESYAIKVYELGLKYYPNYYEFYLSLYELESNKHNKRAKINLYKAETLLKAIEDDSVEKNDILNIIKSEKLKHGW